jgi:hypothetical protein
MSNDKKIYSSPQYRNLNTKPGTPDSNFSKIYPKDDGWYTLDDNGKEVKLSGGIIKEGNGDGSTLRSDSENLADGDCSTVSGGYLNTAKYLASTISGGISNIVDSPFSTIGGGIENEIKYSCSCGEGGGSSILGGGFNTIDGSVSSISGGYINSIKGNSSFIGGGGCNTIVGYKSSILGGERNSIRNSDSSSILGGFKNTINGNYSYILGGENNTASSCCSTIINGFESTVSHCGSTVIGSNMVSVCEETTHMNKIHLRDSGSTTSFNPVLVLDTADNNMVKTRNMGGLFAQTATGTDITGTSDESSLIIGGTGGTGYLIIPENGLQIGDSFTAKLGGEIKALNNENLRLRIKTNGSVILADSGVYTFKGDVGQSGANSWDLDVSFTIRSLGGTGSASISSGGTFSYNQDANYVLEGISFHTLNNTDFDTTILNTLEITAEWGSANASNSIFSEYFVLTKIY